MAPPGIVGHPRVERSTIPNEKGRELPTGSEWMERYIGMDVHVELNHELNVSTRDRPARTGADARIEEPGAKGELRLALQPYGRQFKRRFPYHR
jgi:hypothetical protein